MSSFEKQTQNNQHELYYLEYWAPLGTHLLVLAKTTVHFEAFPNNLSCIYYGLKRGFVKIFKFSAFIQRQQLQNFIINIFILYFYFKPNFFIILYYLLLYYFFYFLFGLQGPQNEYFLKVHS